MRMPLSLIHSFFPYPLSPDQIAEALIAQGIEVDQIVHATPPFSGVVVGEILSVSPHPHAERLQVAQVDDGLGLSSVVCGAPNCRAGLRVAFAKEGALLQERKIQKCRIKEIASEGMLCSEKELGISSRAEEILELPKNWTKGEDLLPLLWDPIFDIALTPNLGHCMSALGLARELSAAFQKPLSLPIAPKIPKKVSKKQFHLQILDPDLCPKMVCRIIEGVAIAPSPFWLQKVLLSCGLTPINNAVDIANYILFKRGQPLHIFDFDSIEGEEVRVGQIQKKQSFLGLDGVVREVSEGTLMISDCHQLLAIAGILGGKTSAVQSQTHTLLLEGAFYDPKTIRRSSKELMLRTESVQRFEKGVDPNGIVDALDEASALILELCGGRLIEDMLDAHSRPFPHKEIECRCARVNGLLGTSLSLSEIGHCFQRLHFGVSLKEEEKMLVSVPPFRHDIQEEIDLIEEVARIYGYTHIERSGLHFPSFQIPHDRNYLFEREVRHRLVALGLQEFLTADLISPTEASWVEEGIHPSLSLLKAEHAKTEAYSVLRPSLFPGLLCSIAGNCRHGVNTIRGFELGRVHFLRKDQLLEQPMVAIFLTGKGAPPHWGGGRVETDFFDLKGVLENFLFSLHFPPVRFSPAGHPLFHPNRQADIHWNDLLIGSCGEVHPTLAAKADLDQRLFYGELNLAFLRDARKKDLLMRPIPRFPA